MLSKKGMVWILAVALLGSVWGCHAAGPTALKVAKFKMKTMKMKAAKRGFRFRAVTAMEKEYDVNKNGLIDPQEAMFLKQRQMYDNSLKQWRKMDLDGDGAVSAAEYEAAIQDQQMNQP